METQEPKTGPGHTIQKPTTVHILLRQVAAFRGRRVRGTVGSAMGLRRGGILDKKGRRGKGVTRTRYLPIEGNSLRLGGLHLRAKEISGKGIHEGGEGSLTAGLWGILIVFW